MLRSVFAVRHGRVAVTFEGGHVAEVGGPNSSGTREVRHMQHGSSCAHPAGEKAPTADVAAKSESAAASGEGATPEAAAAAANATASAVDIAYSGDASMVAIATEDKRVCVWRTGAAQSTATKVEPVAAAAAAAAGAAGDVLGERDLPKKPTCVLFAPVKAAAGGAGSGGGGGGVASADGGKETATDEVIVIADKCGDAYAAPLPDPSKALKHLLGHTAMTITAMVPLKGGTLLATADRAEHIRVSQFPRTTLVHTYLLGHKDFVSALAAVPGEGDRGVFLLSGGGDGMVGLWDAEAGKELAMISVRQACQDLADGDAASEGVAHMEILEADASDGGTGDTNGGVDGGGQEEGGEGGKECAPTAVATGEGGGGGAAIESKGDGVGDSGNGDVDNRSGGSSGGGGGGGGGVPLSVSCSEDGRTVAVVVSGLEGLLLLNLSCGGGSGEGGQTPAGTGAASLTSRARLQLPSVPIQAGFVDGDLVVALPSGSSTDCLQVFRLDDGGEGAVPATSGGARDKCEAINAWAREQAKTGTGSHDKGGGMVLKAAVPDSDASEALDGGLRKHKGTRNAGKSPSGWNNFSKRRDKKPDKKRKRPRPPTPSPTVQPSAAD